MLFDCDSNLGNKSPDPLWVGKEVRLSRLRNPRTSNFPDTFDAGNHLYCLVFRLTLPDGILGNILANLQTAQTEVRLSRLRIDCISNFPDRFFGEKNHRLAF